MDTQPPPSSAFDQVVLPHLDSAYNLARWLTRNEHDAEDVVQEAFLRALRFFGGFHSGNARAWLLAIVRNTCYDWLRRHRPSEAADPFDEEVHSAGDESPTPEDLVIAQADRLRLREALEALPLAWREVLILRELEGLSYKEIADVAGIKMGTVMSRLARALPGCSSGWPSTSRRSERVTCNDFGTLLHGYMDGELDLVRHVEIEDHLRTCSRCSRIYQAQLALRSALKSDELYFRAPARLERQVRMAAQRAESKSWLPRRQTPGWIGAALAAAAVVAFAVFVWPMLSRPSPTERIAQDVVSAHIRSLMPGHLTDVPSSEQHTVKPWFAGKLDFSPPVADLSAEGFPLVGGRLDYAAGRAVAALVYRRGEHFINLFVWPSASTREIAETADARHGYSLVYWTRGQMNFWAISDLNATELRQFAGLVRGRVS